MRPMGWCADLVLSSLDLLATIVVIIPIVVCYVCCGRTQPDITSSSGCPGIFKCPDSGLPVFSFPDFGHLTLLSSRKALDYFLQDIQLQTSMPKIHSNAPQRS